MIFFILGVHWGIMGESCRGASDSSVEPSLKNRRPKKRETFFYTREIPKIPESKHFLEFDLICGMVCVYEFFSRMVDPDRSQTTPNRVKCPYFRKVAKKVAKEIKKK